ncbi:MAG: TadE/TadG family type IV pilus assembly protein [Acidimicrobiales bacterium]
MTASAPDLNVSRRAGPDHNRRKCQVACRTALQDDRTDRPSPKSVPTRSLPQPTRSRGPYNNDAVAETGLRSPSLARHRPGGRRHASRSARWRGESGAVAAELVIATPLLLLLILGVIQFALWEHATNLAEAAAQQGLSVARLQGETAQAGTAETQSVLTQLAGGVLIGPQVRATRTGASTTVVVSGHAESVVGLFSLPVQATAVGPTEPAVPGAGP